MPYYAVAIGRKPGVYDTWEDAKQQVVRFPGAKHKKFDDLMEAEAFVLSAEEQVHVPRDLVANVATNPNMKSVIASSQAVDTASKGAREVVNASANVATKPNKKQAPKEPVVVRRKPAVQEVEKDDHVATKPKRTAKGVAKKPIHVFTDGSCLGNGTCAASRKAGYAVVFPDHPEMHIAEPLDGKEKTNNRAEMMAIIRAFDASDAIDPSRQRPMHLYTDSQVTMKAIQDWMPAWKANNWRKADGKMVGNLDLVMQLDKMLCSGRQCEIKHVEAHTRGKDWHSMWNDVADRLAKDAAAKMVSH